jgi:hypothetical protein
MTQSKKTSFLNVDLDLKATDGLARIVKALRPAMLALHCSDQEATLELAVQPASAAQGLDEIATAVRRLPSELKAAWDACGTRRMDVGVAAGREPRHMLFVVPHPTLLRLSEIGADLVFTVYGAEQSSALRPPEGTKARKVRRRGPAKRSTGRT